MGLQFSIVFFICLAGSVWSFGQVNREWRNEDMALIDSVAKLNKENPKEIESFFTPLRYLRPDTLGFGWVKVKKAIGAGYISIRADFYYYNDTIKAYMLYAYLPDEDELKEEYKSVFRKFLTSDGDQKYSYKYNEQAILRPLPQFYNTKYSFDTSAGIINYMSPFSDIVYGEAGGISNSTLENRQLFNDLENTLTPDRVVQIMYSINPASRLTAVEYYFKNRAKFKNRNSIEYWIEQVYRALPKVGTMSGCILFLENSRKLVQQFSGNKGVKAKSL